MRYARAMISARRALGVSAVVASTLLLRASAARAEPRDPWWGPDKAEHLAVGAALSGGGYALGAATWGDRSKAIALGLAIALAAGAAKEGLDATGFGDPSWKDFAWDAIGAVCGVGIAMGIDWGVHGASATVHF